MKKTKTKTTRTTTDFGSFLRRLVDKDPTLAEMVAEESLNLDIAQKIHDARKAAGLTQKELAVLAGTKQSVISRLERADYAGHTLQMLMRIANALNRRLCVEFYAKPVFTDHFAGLPVTRELEDREVEWPPAQIREPEGGKVEWRPVTRSVTVTEWKSVGEYEFAS